MSEPFRKAAEPAQQVSQPVVDKPIVDAGTPVETHIDSLLATYQDDQGKPYVAQYLEVSEIWDKEPTLKNELNTIEGFLRDEVKKGNLENNVKAASKYLKDLEKKAETNPYESTTKRLSKILAYIDFRRTVNG